GGGTQVKRILHSRQRGAGGINLSLPTSTCPTCYGSSIERGPRSKNLRFRLIQSIFCLAPLGRFASRALVVPPAPPQQHLGLCSRKSSAQLIVFKPNQWFAGEDIVIGLRQHLGDERSYNRCNFYFTGQGFDTSRSYCMPAARCWDSTSCLWG